MKPSLPAAALCAAAALAAAALGAASCGKPRAAVPESPGADLVVYSAHPEELVRLVVTEFRERTGLSVRLVQGGTGELLRRLRAELEEGGETGDVLWGGGAESLEANEDLFDPYRSPEAAAVPPEYKAAAGTWTGFSVLPMVIVYNRRLLPENRAPKSWGDILAPRFAGRIAYADPASSGSAYTILKTATTAIARRRPGGSATAAFARALDGRVLRESTQVIPSVASGEFLVGLSFENAAAEMTGTGADIGIVYPADGTSAVPDGVALIRGSRRREAAERFQDFVLGADVARVLSGRFGRRPARADLPPPDGLPPLDGLPLLSYDIAAAAEEKDALVAAFKRELERGNGDAPVQAPGSASSGTNLPSRN
jgi:iron(III) transport system substrate-binding protein